MRSIIKLAFRSTCFLVMSIQIAAAQDAPPPLRVLVATYGAGTLAIGATILLQQQCANATNDCKILCNNDAMHIDPAPHIQKECKIAWRCGRRDILVDTVPEGNDEQTISCN
jgi:hypothetical protein